MVSLDSFMPRLAPYVVGVAKPLAHQALVDSAIQFCEETGVIRATLDPFTTLVGEATYPLMPAPHTEVSRVIKVWIGKRLVYMAPEAATDDLRGATTQTDSTSGAPLWGAVVEQDSITLVPTPDTADIPVAVRAIIRPTRTASQLDSELFARWGEAIVGGAISRLAAIPGQPFSDPGQAQRGDALFWQGVSRAKVHATRGTTATPLAVRQRPFA